MFVVLTFLVPAILFAQGTKQPYEVQRGSISRRGVIYERIETHVDPKTGQKYEARYVGQSWDWETFERRMERHNHDLQRKRQDASAQYEFRVVSRPLQTELDAAEEAWIRKKGGLLREDGELENKRHQIRSWEETRQARIRESEAERETRRASELDRAARRGIEEKRLNDWDKERIERERRERERRRVERERGRR